MIIILFFFILDKSKIILEEKEVIPSMNIPEFVSRISSTYFKLLTGGTEY